MLLQYALEEPSCLGMQLKMGGKFHLKLNIGERPIENKYHEGKRLKQYVKLLKGEHLKSVASCEIQPPPVKWLGVLLAQQVSINFDCQIKAEGMWHPLGCVISFGSHVMIGIEELGMP
jgi:hypothetical protein